MAGARATASHPGAGTVVQLSAALITTTASHIVTWDMLAVSVNLCEERKYNDGAV
jgi:hypothetical protein